MGGITYSGFELIDGSYWGSISRVKYYGKLVDASLFLVSSKEGLHEVIPGTRDEVTHALLRHKLQIEGSPYADGAYIYDVIRAKILWKNGRAVGYYSEFTHLEFPTLAEIYVAPEYRGHGYGIEMLKDFVNSHRGEPIAFYHIHKKCMRDLLTKVGLVKRSSEGYIMDSIIQLLHWQRDPIPFWKSDKYD